MLSHPLSTFAAIILQTAPGDKTCDMDTIRNEFRINGRSSDEETADDDDCTTTVSGKVSGSTNNTGYAPANNKENTNPILSALAAASAAAVAANYSAAAMCSSIDVQSASMLNSSRGLMSAAAAAAATMTAAAAAVPSTGGSTSMQPPQQSSYTFGAAQPPNPTKRPRSYGADRRPLGHRMRASGGAGVNYCVFCENNNEPVAVYKSHVVRDVYGRCQCPVLRRYICPRCGAKGDNAHTLRYCTKKPIITMDEVLHGAGGDESNLSKRPHHYHSQGNLAGGGNGGGGGNRGVHSQQQQQQQRSRVRM